VREFIVTVIGLLAAALSTAVIFAAFSGPEIPFFALVFLYSVVAVIPAVGFGGIFFVVLRSFNLVRWWSAALGGVAVGALVAPLFSGTPDKWRLAGICLVSGALSGLVFWLVWKAGMRRNAPKAQHASTIDVPSA
jgi:hypothetical protein